MAKKDDLPAMPFYVGDWLKAPDIQCLSYELKGLWFEMLCYMWESTERGVLVKASGTPYSIPELSRLLRLPEDLLKQNLKQLSEFAVYSVRESDGAIYSRRMVRDQEIREKRKISGSLGGKKTFAQAKYQANSQAKLEQNTENEIENENVINNSSLKELMPEPVIKQKEGETRTDIFSQLMNGDQIRSPDFLEAWGRWIDHKREEGKPVTSITAKDQLVYLAALGNNRAIEQIKTSITNGWSGLRYDSKDRSGSKSSSPVPSGGGGFKYSDPAALLMDGGNTETS